MKYTAELSRPSIGPASFAVILSVGNLLLYHYPLYVFGSGNIDISTWNGAQTMLTVAGIVAIATTLVLLALAIVSVRVLKLCAIIVALGNAMAVYFISSYGVVLDKAMMGNVFDTRTTESSEFLHPSLAVWVLLLGVLPSIAIVRARVRSAPRWRSLLALGAGVLALLMFVYANASTALWIDKHAKRIGGLIVPWSYVLNGAKVQADRLRADDVRTPLPDARVVDGDRTVVVLVIGETARAANFSLYGYERPTNPRLAEKGVVVLPDASACSTYTTASLHCMLSHDGARRGSDEPLPSYLHRSGVDVIWRTANWGEPPIEVDDYEKASALRADCDGDGCAFDEVLLTGLTERIRASTKRKVFAVLHTKGSHGPSYHTRYPEEFARFEPVCESVELSRCDEAELINAYDNTLVYTDHMLARTIESLEALGDTATLMMYVSDHGESLGEFGLYLHGTPWSLAPDVQKDIPFLLWMSPAFRRANDIDDAALRRGSHSHAEVFHSVLGALGMTGPVHDKRLDLFAR